MKYILHFRFIAIIIALCFTLSTEAQNNPWKQVCKLPATNAFYITNSGNMLLADYLFDMNGGIYISTDKGNSWEKTDVQDYNYNYFVENENYIFAAGYSAHIARSADDGLTWEVISYADAVEEEDHRPLGFGVGRIIALFGKNIIKFNRELTSCRFKVIKLQEYIIPIIDNISFTTI